MPCTADSDRGAYRIDASLPPRDVALCLIGEIHAVTLQAAVGKTLCHGGVVGPLAWL